MLVKITNNIHKSVEREITSFVDSCGGIDALVGCTSLNIYEEYCEFCKKNSKKPMSKTGLMQRICSEYECTTIVVKHKGKAVRVLVYCI